MPFRSQTKSGAERYMEDEPTLQEQNKTKVTRKRLTPLTITTPKVEEKFTDRTTPIKFEEKIGPTVEKKPHLLTLNYTREFKPAEGYHVDEPPVIPGIPPLVDDYAPPATSGSGSMVWIVGGALALILAVFAFKGR